MTEQNQTELPVDAERVRQPEAEPVPAIKSDNAPDESASQPQRTGFSKWLYRLRLAAIGVAPALIVNNSSNVLGILQLAGETFMFKANGSMLVSPENRGKLLHYLIDPPLNIYRSLLSNAGSSFQWKDLLKPSHYSKFFSSLWDVKGATAADLKINPHLINRWQARATLTVMSVWALNTLIPERQDQQEDVDKMTALYRRSPVAYFTTRIKQALWVPDWLGHKRQFTGLGIMVGGLCTMMSGFRNVAKDAAGARFYFINPQHSIMGAISFCASLPMLFSVDDDLGYSKYGSINLGRVLFLPGSIWKKFAPAKGAIDAGAWWYLGAHSLFQSQNALAGLIGGAEKKPDGTIVDHAAMRAEARRKALEKHKAEEAEDKRPVIKTHSDAAELPPTTIRHVASREAAMPERVSQANATPHVNPA